MDFTSILNQSLQQDVSDVFLTDGLPVSVRRHGSIENLDLVSTSLEPWLKEILTPSQWEQLDAEGDLDAGLQTAESRFRLNIARSQGRWSVVARPLPFGRFSYEDLGLPSNIGSFLQHRSGIVLVTGATGSGKSTTLAAMIHQLNSEKKYHIVTIEDPIEYIHTPIQSKLTQREVGSDTQSFLEGLKRVVRQSPDVIMIGEMRDQESIQVAMAAALTGHLVLATLHTIDATQTLQRLMSYFPEHARSQVAVDLSLSLRGIVSQRLLPNIDGDGRVVSVELLTNTPLQFCQPS